MSEGSTSNTLCASDVSQYTYRPLARQEIRVLRLYAGEHGRALAITITHVALKVMQLPAQTAHYEALSYAWGRSDLEHRVILNELHFTFITRSLYDALVHLRSPSQDRVIWADAICINQTDQSEKSVQVSMMGDIYRFASSTVVWLGRSHGQASSIFAFMAGLELRQQWAASDIEKSADFPDREIRDFMLSRPCACCEDVSLPDDLQGQNIEPWERASAEYSKALSDLLRREWFRRLWVVQEFALAAKVFIQCGKHAIGWDYFVNAARFLRAYHLKHRPDNQYYSDRASLRQTLLINMIDELDLLTRSRQKSISDAVSGRSGVEGFIRILYELNHRMCTNPLDRIYAIRSLCDTPEWPSLLPSYGLSQYELYKRFVVDCLRFGEATPSQDSPYACTEAILLSLACVSARHEYWATWVPDLNGLRSSQFGQKAVLYGLVARPVPIAEIPQERGRMRCAYAPESECLRLGGHIFASVIAKAAPPDTVDENDRPDYSDAPGVSQPTRSDDRRVSEAASVVEQVGMDPNSMMHAQLLYLAQRYASTLTRQTADHIRKAVRQSLGLESPETLVVVELLSGVVSFGWASDSVCLGDRVAFVEGAPFAFVVRATESAGGYSLVTEAVFPCLSQEDVLPPRRRADWIMLV